ncbi:MAG: hypothetical protein PF485_12655 [Bacteroidales bacterium]|jgi:nitrate reductase cytochrome c-type subunit|nr:hypothetical protein [Bacteroidales bacterium]
MKIVLLIKFIIISSFFFFFTSNSQAQQDDEKVEMPESNNTCLKCHGHKYYSFYNKNKELNERKLMNPYFVIDSISYLQGEHKALSCSDCHSEVYETYPHKCELKIEPKLTCVDCHDFEEIASEVKKSVHMEAFEAFHCELCHDPHSNKLVKSNMAELVQYNNNRCLSCHNNVDKYQIYATHENPKLIDTHDWLPNQALHFARVRCIECHTAVTDTADAVHHIVPKEQAVRNCVECHSSNSSLRDKLYKHQSKEDRAEFNFYNSFILNDAYIIGANRNSYVNLISLIIFGLTLSGIFFHTLLRIIKRK